MYEAANTAGARRISLPEGAVTALVIPTDEQVVIARGVAGLLDAPVGLDEASPR